LGRFGVLRIFVIILLSGCAGYVPVAKYAKSTLPEPVYVKVKLSGVEPQNGVYIKDEIDRVLLTRFHSRVTKRRELSKSQIYVNSYSIQYSPINYDKDGFVTRYSVDTEIKFTLHTPKGILNKKISTSEDVSVQSSSLLSSTAKESAIRVSINKAMDKFIDYIAKKGVR
jgi:hypothetical protein